MIERGGFMGTLDKSSHSMNFEPRNDFQHVPEKMLFLKKSRSHYPSSAI